MSATVSVKCSQCRAPLKLKSTAAGKKIRCPKCQHVFVVPAPAAGDEDEFAALLEADADEFGDFSGDEEGDDTPVSRPAKRGSKKRKKKGRKAAASEGGGGAKVLLIGLGVLAAIGLLGGGVFLAVKFLPLVGLGAPSRMAWLPDDTETLTEVRVAELWNAPVLQPLRTAQVTTAITDSVMNQYGIRPEEIERLVVGQAGAGGPGATENSVAVVYVKTPFDEPKRATVTGQASAVEYNGATYYTKPRGAGAIYFPRENVVVYGSEARIKAAIDSKGKCAAEEKFAFAPAGGHLSMAVLADALAQRQQELPAPVSRGLSTLPGGVAATDVRSVAIRLDATAELRIESVLVCITAPKAEEVASAVRTGKDEQLTQLRQAQGQSLPIPFMDPAQAQALMDGQRQMLATTQATASGDTARVSMTIPGKTIETLAQALGPLLSNMGSILGGAPQPPPLFSPGGTPPPGGSQGTTP